MAKSKTQKPLDEIGYFFFCLFSLMTREGCFDEEKYKCKTLLIPLSKRVFVQDRSKLIYRTSSIGGVCNINNEMYLYVALFNNNVCGVAELDELLHGLLVHVPDGDLGGARLRQLAREHRAEVRAAC